MTNIQLRKTIVFTVLWIIVHVESIQNCTSTDFTTGRKHVTGPRYRDVSWQQHNYS